eukprot:tig00001041_g6564.t1
MGNMLHACFPSLVDAPRTRNFGPMPGMPGAPMGMPGMPGAPMGMPGAYPPQGFPPQQQGYFGPSGQPTPYPHQNPMMMGGMQPCMVCRGTGMKPHNPAKPCKACKGARTVPPNRRVVPCKKCRGSGANHKKGGPCKRCSGMGRGYDSD